MPYQYTKWGTQISYDISYGNTVEYFTTLDEAKFRSAEVGASIWEVRRKLLWFGWVLEKKELIAIRYDPHFQYDQHTGEGYPADNRNS